MSKYLDPSGRGPGARTLAIRGVGFGLALALAVPHVHAGMIGVDDLERTRVKEMLALVRLEGLRRAAG